MPLPKPTALKIAEGTKDSYPINEPQPGALKSRKPPAFLDADAKKVWRELVDEFAVLMLITQVDRQKFAHYCKAIALANQLAGDIQTNGTYVTAVNKKGFSTQQHRPAWQQYLDAVRLADKLGIQFGDSPAARGRIKMIEEEEDELAKLLGAKPA